MSVSLGRELVQASYCSRNDEADEGLSISLTQPAGSTSRWLFVVRARTDDGGLVTLGHFYTCPPSLDSPHTRVVAIASCPGAREWTVDVSPAQALAQDPIPMEPDNSAVSLAGGRPLSCCRGVQRVSERPRFLSGAAAQVAVHWGQRIVAITATGNGSLGVCDVADPFNGFLVGSLYFPAAAPARFECDGLMQGTLVLTFSSTSQFFVELAESA